jgi:Protein of unknown function (DUF4019)
MGTIITRKTVKAISLAPGFSQVATDNTSVPKPLRAFWITALKCGANKNLKAPRYVVFSFVLLAFTFAGCALKANREGLPAEVQTAINAVGEDIAADRYEKIYREAAEEWRRDSTLEQSTTVFETVKTKLGRVQSRALHTAAEEQNSGGKLAGRSFVVSYQTKFEGGEGMETFTLVERAGRWLLAGYFVNSTALR